MKIQRYELAHVALAYRRPVNWFNSSEDGADCVIVRLIGDDGAAGVAEAPVRRTWCGKTVCMMLDALTELFLPSLAGIDLSDTAAVDRALARFPDNHLPRMILDNAIVALRAAAAGVPLWRHLGGVAEVETSWCVTRQPVAAMVAEAEDLVARHGFGTLKVKGGQGLETDLAVLRALGAALPGVRLTVDANAAYPRGEALDYVRRIADCGVVIAEDPCPLGADPFVGELSEAAPVPILVDMPCLTAADVAAMAANGARAVSTKPGRVGFGEAGRMNMVAREWGLALASGTYGESALGSLVSLCHAGTLGEAMAPAEQSFFLIFADSILTRPVGLREGRVRLPDEPVDALVDWDRVAHDARQRRAANL